MNYKKYAGQLSGIEERLRRTVERQRGQGKKRREKRNQREQALISLVKEYEKIRLPRDKEEHGALSKKRILRDTMLTLMDTLGESAFSNDDVKRYLRERGYRMSYKRYADGLGKAATLRENMVPPWWKEWFSERYDDIIAKVDLGIVDDYLLHPEGRLIRRDELAEDVYNVLKQLGHDEFAGSGHEAIQEAVYDEQPTRIRQSVVFPSTLEGFLQWVDNSEEEELVPTELWSRVYDAVRKRMVDSDVDSLLRKQG